MDSTSEETWIHKYCDFLVFCGLKIKMTEDNFSVGISLDPVLLRTLQIIHREKNIGRFEFRVSPDNDVVTLDAQTGRKLPRFSHECTFQIHGCTYYSEDGVDYRLAEAWKMPLDAPRRLNFCSLLEHYEQKLNFLIGLLPETGRNEEYWLQVDQDTMKRVKPDSQSSLEKSLDDSPLFERRVLNIVFEMAGWSTCSRKPASKRPRPE